MVKRVSLVFGNQSKEHYLHHIVGEVGELRNMDPEALITDTYVICQPVYRDQALELQTRLNFVQQCNIPLLPDIVGCRNMRNDVQVLDVRYLLI